MWYDLFCGGGLASCGAHAAGFQVVCGVDNDPNAVDAYRRNFPDAAVELVTLGDDDDAPWPAPLPHVHVHLSPPCGELSSAKAGPRNSSGVRLLRWSIAQAVARGYASWSVETVFSPESKAVVASLAKAFPTSVARAHVDAANLGSPQSRVRLIVGPPELIERLRALPCPPRVSIRRAFEAAGLPVRAPYVKSQSVPPAVRSVEDVSPTVCASRALIWCDHTATTVKCMNSADSRCLMGLGPEYRLSGKHYVDQRVLGNGVCFHVARGIARAAPARTAGGVVTT